MVPTDDKKEKKKKVWFQLWNFAILEPLLTSHWGMKLYNFVPKYRYRATFGNLEHALICKNLAAPQ